MLRAARAVTDGRWAAADRHVDESIALGSDDPAHAIALFGHRVGRLRAQERSEELLQIVEDDIEQLKNVPKWHVLYAAMHAAACARAGQLDRARESLRQAAGTLTFEDVAFSSMYTETAVAVGDRDACAAAVALLERWTSRFMGGGPMFMYSGDPVERYLGLALAQLGERARAIEHLESALNRLREANAAPFIARTALDLAALLDSGNASESARAVVLRAEAEDLAERFDLVDLRPRASVTASSVPMVPSSPGFTLVREGDSWAITSRGATFRMRDSRGLRILARLIENAGTDLHALDLADSTDGTVDVGDAGVVLDARARAEYRARLVDLRDDLADAERRGDLGWIDRLRTEAELIQMQLSRAFAPSGRQRRSGAAAERARSAVTRRVREAIAKLAEHDPALGEHLEWAVRTGMTCSYRANRQ